MEKFQSIQHYKKIEIGANIDINLWDVRIFQRNTIFIMGLPKILADKKILSQQEFLGQYGKIIYILIKKVENKKQISNRFYFYQTHVKYSSEDEAALALISLQKLKINDRQIKVFYGMSRFCPKIIKNNKCQNKQCPYVHLLNKKDDWFLKNDNVKKLYFLNYDKKQIIQKIVKNKTWIQNHLNKQDNFLNVFPGVESLIQQYCTIKILKDQQTKQIIFNSDLFQKQELNILKEKLMFKVIKIKQKIQSLNNYISIYLNNKNNFLKNVFVNLESYQKQINISNILYQMNLQRQQLNFESFLLDYVFKKLQKKKFQKKIYNLYKQNLKQSIKQKIEANYFLIQFALNVYCQFESGQKIKLLNLFYQQSQIYSQIIFIKLNIKNLNEKFKKIIFDWSFFLKFLNTFQNFGQLNLLINLSIL